MHFQCVCVCVCPCSCEPTGPVSDQSVCPSSSRPPLSSGPAPLRLNRALSGAADGQSGTWTVCACVKCLISLYILSVNECSVYLLCYCIIIYYICIQYYNAVPTI